MGNYKLNLYAVMLALASVSVPAQAVTQDAFCDFVTTAAGAVMYTRQSGAPLSKALAKHVTGNTSTDAVVREIVLEAYRQPLWSNNRHKNLAIAVFKDRWTVNCYTVVSR